MRQLLTLPALAHPALARSNLSICIVNAASTCTAAVCFGGYMCFNVAMPTPRSKAYDTPRRSSRLSSLNFWKYHCIFNCCTRVTSHNMASTLAVTDGDRNTKNILRMLAVHNVHTAPFFGSSR
ncbi:hypothetical protein GALMADRAFT_886010 [Galerina marginata CBS 339.88]|uniref:Secreted protein n=1 Tax=Galerina marginata (strain CBS 339.88) TaxID=685588 RepID=A0A067SUR5_GALM3|nr:hypothetical protein GALMADRAFT_886010 [Galerina marginata CBS 339.88]